MLRFSLLLFLALTFLPSSLHAKASFRRPLAGPLSAPTTDYRPFDPSYQLVWSDEFNQTDNTPPDPSIWTHEVGGNEPNDELEYYTDSLNNSYVANGRLHIIGRQQQDKNRNFTSARINTQGKVEVLYGLIAARARITMYDGYWPAFWLIGSQSQRVNWPRCGEMDIMEQVNGRGTGTAQDDSLQFGTLHYNQYGINSTKINHESTGGIIKQKPNHYWGDEFHLYQALWTDTTYTFMVDDLAYETIDLTSDVKYDSFRDVTNPFFFIINLALGGDFPKHTPNDGFPAEFEIDWVRVWQQSSQHQSGGGVWTNKQHQQQQPVQWVDEERRVKDAEVDRMQSMKVRDGSRYMGQKPHENVRVIKSE